FVELANEYGVELEDIRKSPPLDELHYFKNRKEQIDALTIPFLGTDSSVGKRTALLETYEAMKERGAKVEWIATGQTGLLQGSEYGLPLDSIKGDYMVGELEYQIWKAWKDKKPDYILIEGQGSISHPAYVCGSRAVLAGSQPDAVVLQHAPARKYRHYQSEDIQWPMPNLEDEIHLIRSYSGADVIAITINPEDLTEEEKKRYAVEYEQRFNIPSTDALESPEKIAERIELQKDLQE
ncbi:MAG: NAD-dependent epimerase/dehydratase family protein, partial [Candidatus Thermoplasmatota archaeon]